MRALLTALLIAGLPVRPPSEVPKLIGEARGRTVVLHFWASWCDACREEFPRLRSRFRELAAQGARVELISIDRPEDSEKAQAMLKEFGLSKLPAILVDAPDPDPVVRAVGDPRWDGTLPATFVYDASGKLSHRFIGRIRNPATLRVR